MGEVEILLTSLVPAITALIGIVGGSVSIPRFVKKIIKGTGDDVSQMKREYKEINKQLKEVKTTNSELTETIKKQNDKIASLEGKIEVLTNVEKERLQQEAINKDMDI